MTLRVPGGIDWSAVQQAVRLWVINGSGLPESSVYWGQQQAGRPPSPAVCLRVDHIENLGIDWADPEDNPLTFADLTVAGLSAVTDVISIPAHALLTGDGPVRLTTTGVAPGNLTTTRNYWVVRVDDNNIKLALTFQFAMGSPAQTVDITSTGSGTLKVVDQPETLRAGQEQVQLARGVWRVTVVLESYAQDGAGLGMAQSILQRVAARRGLPSQTDLLDDANIGLLDVGNVRAVGGTQSGVLFMPFAYCDVHFNLVSEDAEFGGIIEKVDALDQISGKSLELDV